MLADCDLFDITFKFESTYTNRKNREKHNKQDKN